MTDSTNKTTALVAHLIELRKYFLRSCYVFFAVFVTLFNFSGPLFELLARPILQSMPGGQHLIATAVTGTLVAPLKLSFFLSLFLTIPVLLYQVWSFFAPGLYKHERYLIWPLLIISTLLFYCGMSFCYFIVFPLMFKFFVSITPLHVNLTPDIDSYVGFCLKMFMAFGLAFEVPIITLLLARSGIVDVESLQGKRPYVLVIAFTLGMILTPPDVLSQVLLAVPLYLLFEVGLLLAKFLPHPPKTTMYSE
jgi:sec-independent protein translocase protein TatC